MQDPQFDATAELPIVFDDVLVIVGGGVVDGALLARLHAGGARIIAADGGAEECARAGVLPEIIIGDMDSVHDLHVWETKARVIPLTEQLTTDFEKCLYATKAPVTVALGMTGGRFDHTLAALDAVTRHAAERAIILVDEEDLALGVSGDFAFSVAQGERVSVHPLGAVVFARSSGLKYPLDGLTLAPGIRTGTSNEAVNGAFEIMPEARQAPWLLILGRDNLSNLMAHLR